MKSIAILAATFTLSFGAFAQVEDPVIGEVLGKPVRGSDVTSPSGQERASELRAKFIMPAVRAYLAPHKDEIALTESEARAITDSYNALMKCKPEIGLRKMEPPFDKAFAQMIGGSAKAQRFIYLNHGRGRLLFQQAGMEAFDAMRNLVLELEQKGSFKFESQVDRDLALAYWTTQNHSSFLLPDPGSEEAFQLDALMPKCHSD